MAIDETNPTETHTAPAATEGSAHANNHFTRRSALRIRVPADFQAASQRVTERLVIALRKVFSSKADIEEVEFLAFPAAQTREQVYILSVTVPTLPASPQFDADGEQTRLRDSISNARDPTPGSVGHATKVLAEKLGTHLPSTVDISPVSVDFGPLGVTSAATCRLVTPRDRRITKAERLSDASPFVSLLESLSDSAYLYQVLISDRSRTEFHVSVRLALYDAVHQVSTDAALAAIVRHGRRYDPSVAFDDLGVTSNFRIMSEHLHAFGDTVTTLWTADISDSTRLKALAKGHVEHRDLLRGRIGYDPTYRDLGYFPKFVIRERDLCQFLGLHAVAPTAPWRAVSGRGPPLVNRTELNRQKPHAADSTNSTRERRTPGTTKPSQRDGSIEHQEGVARTAQVLRERGFEVEIIEQDPAGSVPDLWALSPSGDVFAVEVEFKNDTKPASFLTNAIRAEQWGMQMLVVGVGETPNAAKSGADKAQTAANKLQQPFRRAENDQTRLYTQSAVVRLDDGTTPLLPQSVAEAPWFLTPEGTLELCIDDTIVGAGDATDSVTTYEYDLPVYAERDGQHVVETPAGDIRHRYDTKEGFESEWTYLRAPLVPTRLQYLSGTTFKYLDRTGDLREFHIQTDWDAVEHQKRYENGLRDYFDRFVVQRPDERVPRTDLRTHALGWFRRLTAHKAPNNSYFEQCRPKYEPVEKRRHADGSVFYDGLTWRYPPAIVSPDLPDLSAGPAYPTEWDEESGETTPTAERAGEGDSEGDTGTNNS
jgi:hypothetical protein